MYFRNYRVPQIINKENKLYRIILFALLTWMLYSIAAYFHIGSPKLLPLTPFEENIPFLPWTIWVYIALYPFNMVCFYLLKDENNMNRTAYLFILMQLIAFTIFMLSPTAYPVDSFPLPISESLTNNLFSLIRHLDEPVNCLPSLHVANCFLFSFSYLNEQQKKFPIIILISVIISLSTLTTKQHYLVDIFGGFILASAVYFGLGRVIRFKTPSRSATYHL